MLNQRPRRSPPPLPILYTEDAHIGVVVRLLYSTAERMYPKVTLLERLPDSHWRVGFEDGAEDVFHVSLLASLPLERS